MTISCVVRVEKEGKREVGNCSDERRSNIVSAKCMRNVIGDETCVA